MKTWELKRIFALSCLSLGGVFQTLTYAEVTQSLPFEERFSDFHKGSWRIENRAGGWSSGVIGIEGSTSVRISFDTNQKGNPQSPDVGDNFLKVWYELDGEPGAEPLFYRRGKYAGKLVERSIPVGGHQELVIFIEGKTESKPVQYYLDNLRVESPEEGLLISKRLEEKAPELLPLPPLDPDAGIIRYPRLPGHHESPTYGIEVNGAVIPVEQSWENQILDASAVDYTIAVARFAADFEDSKTINVVVNCNENIDTYSLSPKNLEDFSMKGRGLHSAHKINGDRLSFELNQPAHLMLKVNDLEYLFILVDGLERNPVDPRSDEVVNLAGYLDPSRDPFADITSIVQTAINETAARRKVLFVPNGRYMTGQLVLGSDSRIYLEAGALIQAIPEWNRKLWPAQAGANDTNKDSSFIYVGDPTQYETRGVQNVHIYGRGVIDGNGWNMRHDNDSSLVTANVKLFRSARAECLRVEDIYFRDSARWSFNILMSEDVRFSNVKLINCMVGYIGDWSNNHKFAPATPNPRLFHIPVVTNLDGFDIDASTNVVVEDSFVYTGDDAFTPKVTGYMGLIAPCRNVVIRNNVIWTEKVALKIGPETMADIDNILFIDNHIIRADRFFTANLDGEPGVSFNNIVVADNRTEEISGNFYERFFRFTMAHEGSIVNLLVDGLDCLKIAPQFSTSEGYSDKDRIGFVVIRNVRVKGKPVGETELFGPSPHIKFSSIEVESISSD